MTFATGLVTDKILDPFSGGNKPIIPLISRSIGPHRAKKTRS
jgi:hypothetical protein